MSKHINVHTGEVLREEFLRPLGVTPYRLAKDAKVPNRRVHEIVTEKGRISAETDLHLCAFFGLIPGYWLRLQLVYELREALNTLGPKIKAEVRPLKTARARWIGGKGSVRQSQRNKGRNCAPLRATSLKLTAPELKLHNSFGDTQ